MKGPKNILDYPERSKQKSQFLKKLRRRLSRIITQPSLLILSLCLAILNLYLFTAPDQNLEQIMFLTISEMLFLPAASLFIASPIYSTFFSRYEEDAISWIAILFYLGSVTGIFVWILS